MRRFCSILACIVTLIGLLAYGADVMYRSTAHECKREMSPSGRYVGETCYLAREYGTLFRLYDAHTEELQTERSYLDPDAPHLVWQQDLVQYDVGATDGKGFVTLPPSWKDRLKAKLP